MNKASIIAIVLLVLGLAIGFFGGMKYQQSKTPARNFAQAFQRRGALFTNGNRPISGSIISADDKSLTVALPDGSSKIVILSSSTKINKSSAATSSDLVKGENVLVLGSINSDGSVTAQNVQINPEMPKANN